MKNLQSSPPQLTLEATLHLPCVLNKESTMREWMADPRGKAVFGPIYTQIEIRSRKMFGDDDHHNVNGCSVSVDIMDMMNDMSLVSVLMFHQSALTMPADVMVDGLLRQARNIDQ